MPARWRALGGAAVLLCLLGTGCGDGEGPVSGHTSPVPLPSTTGTAQAVSSENFAYLWPLSVDHGTIECAAGEQAVFVAPDGARYALNENAEAAGVQSIEPLRTGMPGKDKISLGALRSRALGLCHRG